MEQNVIRATEVEFVQIGVYAARDPVTGDFLPSVPLYVPRTPGLTVSEEKLCEDIAQVFALRYRQYRENLEKERAAR